MARKLKVAGKSESKRPAKTRAFDALAKMFEGYEPANKALTTIRAVPTRLIQLDHALRVGGLPTERVTVVHGPSHEGKSGLALDIIGSFLAGGHLALYVDAERATPVEWVRARLGPLADDTVRFKAARPDTYEETVHLVRGWLRTVREAREAGLISEYTSAVMVVDSIRKLVPAGEFDMIVKDKEALAGRAGQRRAQMNAAWLDELVPALEKANAAAVLIAREMDDPDADVWAKKFGNDYKIGGGKSIIFDASVAMRVQRQSYLKKGDAIIGERHKVTIWKNKVSGKEGRSTVWFFHTSNGTEYPAGLDSTRDALELAERLGVVELNGARVLREGKSYAGREAFLQAARENPELAARLLDEVRAKMGEVQPMMHDADGVVE